MEAIVIERIKKCLAERGIVDTNFRMIAGATRHLLSTPLVFNGNTCELDIKFKEGTNILDGGEIWLREPDGFEEKRDYTGEKEFFELLRFKIKRAKFETSFTPGIYLFTQIALSEIRSVIISLGKGKGKSKENKIKVLMQYTQSQTPESLEIFLEEKAYHLVKRDGEEGIVIKDSLGIARRLEKKSQQKEIWIPLDELI